LFRWLVPTLPSVASRVIGRDRQVSDTSDTSDGETTTEAP
jgi:hypothetical protein